MSEGPGEKSSGSYFCDERNTKSQRREDTKKSLGLRALMTKWQQAQVYYQLAFIIADA